MSMAYIAVGSVVVGGLATAYGADKAADASAKGSAAGADATVQSTAMQIEEIQRQYDYQQKVLLPQIQTQYNAQGAFSDLLGISGPEPGQNQQTGYTAQPRAREDEQALRDAEIDILQREIDNTAPGARGHADRQALQSEIDAINARPYDQQRMDAENVARGPQFPGSGATQFQRGQQGEFIDPNLDPTKLADVNTYGDAVRGNLMAGTTAEDDPYRNFISGARLSEGAAGTNVYGEDFQTSPGYSFAVEEMDRASDRVRSAGGNYGGRAIMEAQRRAKGLADQEYYNWAAGRTSDLQRLSSAEAVDISRDDLAYQNYMSREQFDASRLDAAAQQEDALIASDQSRGDQAYYNYLKNLGMVSGFGGGPAATAVNASQVAGSQTAGAYSDQGRQLSQNYMQSGDTQASIQYAKAAGINDAIQGGAENYITYRAAQ